MKTPGLIFADQIKDSDTLAGLSNGQYTKARPRPFYGGIRRRCELAWMVFIGRADALVWNEGD